MQRWSLQIVVAVVALSSVGGTAHAELQQSSSYSINESEVGGIGDFESSSSGYRMAPGVDDGGSTLGEAAVGSSSSANYQSGAGFNTTAQPGLTFCVGTTGSGCADLTGSAIDLGNLSTSAAQTTTAKFSVKNYTTYGYVVTVIGTPPSNSGHALTNLATQTASAAGTEQFGINLRANTSPVSVGADPVPLPSANFSLSDPNVVVNANYRTANQYRYNSGDQIAQAPSNSGETTYTVSFMSNIENVTPGGKYTGSIEFVATGNY